mgnify:CR=1 FL=1
MPTISENRPPYVTFELRAVEDREASIREGHYIAHDVAYAIITPQGSKDRIERVAEEWFVMLERQAQDNRFPREWARAYKAAFEEWKAGNEPAVNGTDVKNWPVLSPSQLRACLELRLRTVEDVAAMNEESILRLGMGGRTLKAKAKDWLEAAASTGKQAENLSALRTAHDDLLLRNKSLEQQVKELQATVAALRPASAQSTKL